MLVTHRRPWLLLVIALLVCATLYWPALHGPFLFDDFPNLGALTSIDHVSSWRDLGIYLSQPRSFPGRPLSMLSFLLQKESWPDNPFAFKLANLGLHLVCGTLVYLLTLRVAQAWPDNNEAVTHNRRAKLAALLAAAAWLLNPIALSGVVLVVQRMTLLMTLFVLLGLLAYLRGLLRQQLPIWRRGAWMALGLGVCTLLAFLSKENGILLPLYALVLDATLLRSFVADLPRSLQWFRRILIWPAILFVFAYLLWIVPDMWGQHGMRDFTIGERLLTEPRVLVSYLDKIFLPRFGIYGLYNDGFPVSHSLFNPASTAACLALLAAALVIALLGLKRLPLLALAILWYLGGQVIESSSVMLELYFEHRNYAPMIGVVMALAIGISRVGTSRYLYLIACGIWLVACCVTTALSARVYASEDVLAFTWARAQPDSIRAQTYLADRLSKHGQWPLALQTIETIATRYPENAGIAEHRVYLLCMQGILTPSDVDRLENILKSSPYDRSGFENTETLRNLATTQRCSAFDDAAWLRNADIMLNNRAYGSDKIAAGYLHYQKHLWAVQHGKLDMAVNELDGANRLDPDANIPRLQAQYLVSAGLYDQAINILRRADERRPPLLRRLLVDDHAINAEQIAEIERLKSTGVRHDSPQIP